MIGAADRLDGGTGDDYMRGGLGADVFVFRMGGGNDIIADFDVTDDGNGGFVGSNTSRDFTVGMDTVELVGFVDIDIDNVMDKVSDQDGNAVFRANSTDGLTFWGLTSADLTADSFIFIDG
jgi:Ca2+-binding RTX toxin-like protein